MCGLKTLEKRKKSPPPPPPKKKKSVDQQAANAQPSADYYLLSYVKFFHQLSADCQPKVYQQLELTDF